MIYSPNESYIHEVPKNDGLIFYMGEVWEPWRKMAVVNNPRFQFEQLFSSI